MAFPEPRQRPRILGETGCLVTFAITFAVLVTSCGLLKHTNPITAAPAPVQKSQVAFDEGSKDAGLKSYDSTGYIVSAGYVQKYRQLLEGYWKKLPVRSQIKPGDYMTGVEVRPPENGVKRFHITFEVNSRYDALNRIDSNSP